MRKSLTLVAMLMAVAPAAAQDFPNRPITLIVPLTAGTTVDVVAHIYGEAVVAKIRTQGIAPKVKARAAFDAHIRDDVTTLGPVVQRIAGDAR